MSTDRKTSYDFDVVVIGGGHNGLTTALSLARTGRRVAVVEAHDRLGGLARSDEIGVRYRTGGVLHDTTGVRPAVVEKLGLFDHGLRLRDEPPPVHCPGPSGPSDGICVSGPAGAESLASADPKSGRDYAVYRDFVSEVGPWLRSVSESAPPELFEPGLRDLAGLGRSAFALRRLGRTTMLDLLRVLPMAAADWLAEMFSNDVARAALAAPALYDTGYGPRAPGTCANLLHRAANRGTGVVGGAPALVEALEAATTDVGVEIVRGRRVGRILVDNGGVHGIGLENGDSISAEAVAASCDPRHVFLDLLPASLLSRTFHGHLRNYRGRGFAAKLDLALSALPPEVETLDPGAHIRIGTCLDELERASDALKYRRFSERPALEVTFPSRESPDLAPAGAATASILVYCAPWAVEGGWSDGRRQELEGAVAARLTEVFPDLPDLVVGSRLLTPLDLDSGHGLVEGHLLHGEHALDQLLVRPVPECARYGTPFPGLFLCGSGSHPGGGLTCAPGALAAQAIEAAI